jgi:HEAT repeat protein
VNLQLVILVIFSTIAAVSSILISLAVVARKSLDEKRAIRRQRLHRTYSSRFAELLLCELNPVKVEPRSHSVYKQYDDLLQPLQVELSRMASGVRRHHHDAMRLVLLDFARDVTGESFERLMYFFEALSLADRELERLRHRSWWIRSEAANILGRMRSRSAVPGLTAALNDSNNDVRLQAMQALLILNGVESLKTILEHSRSLSQWTTIELSVVVAKFHSTAVRYLMEGLTTPDRSVVMFCIEMLAQIGFVSAVEPLLELTTRNSDPEIQEKALEALGRLGDMRANEVLTKFLKHPAPRVRLKAVEAIGKIGGEQAEYAVMPALMSQNFEEKLVGARALAALGTNGFQLLREAVSGTDELTSAIAQQVLEENDALEEMG